MPHLNRLPWREAEAYFKRSGSVMLGAGAIHAHDHIPSGIDNISTDYLMDEVEKRTGILVVPNLPFGPMDNYMEYPGTISLSGAAFAAVIGEVVRDVFKWGARRIFIVNGHGGNTPFLQDIAFEYRKKGALVPIFEWWKLIRHIDPDLDKAVNALPDPVTPGRTARTRGTETAAAMYLTPDAMQDQDIRVIAARPLLTEPFKPNFAAGVVYKGVPVPMPWASRESSEDGEVGTKATVEMGEHILKACVDFMVSFVKDLEAQPVPGFPAHD